LIKEAYIDDSDNEDEKYYSRVVLTDPETKDILKKLMVQYEGPLKKKKNLFKYVLVKNTRELLDDFIETSNKIAKKLENPFFGEKKKTSHLERSDSANPTKSEFFRKVLLNVKLN
jgi:hypothetical protein